MKEIKPFQHQIEKAEECWKILKEKGYVYLARQAQSWEIFNKLINSREVQENLKCIDIDEEGSHFGMGEVPDWRRTYPHLQSDELRTDREVGQREEESSTKTQPKGL